MQLITQLLSLPLDITHFKGSRQHSDTKKTVEKYMFIDEERLQYVYSKVRMWVQILKKAKTYKFMIHI
jgi:hypothetical protein